MSRERAASLAAALALVLALGGAAETWASGAYAGRPPRKPASVDLVAYELGKKIFLGEFVATAGTSDADTQEAVLSELMARLAGEARGRARFMQQAGQLDEEQVEALRYFLEKRYKLQ